LPCSVKVGTRSSSFGGFWLRWTFTLRNFSAVFLPTSMTLLFFLSLWYFRSSIFYGRQNFCISNILLVIIRSIDSISYCQENHSGSSNSIYRIHQLYFVCICVEAQAASCRLQRVLRNFASWFAFNQKISSRHNLNDMVQVLWSTLRVCQFISHWRKEFALFKLKRLFS